MRGISRMTSSHIGLGLVLVRPLKVAISWLPGAATGAELEAPVGDVVEHRGPLGDADRVLLAGGEAVDGRADVDALGLRRPRSPSPTSGADMWLYSVRAWCSPNQAYFQLCLSAWIAYSSLAHELGVLGSVSWAAGPGM
jgi:hypothetical protein